MREFSIANIESEAIEREGSEIVRLLSTSRFTLQHLDIGGLSTLPAAEIWSFCINCPNLMYISLNLSQSEAEGERGSFQIPEDLEPTKSLKSFSLTSRYVNLSEYISRWIGSHLEDLKLVDTSMSGNSMGLLTTNTLHSILFNSRETLKSIHLHRIGISERTKQGFESFKNLSFSNLKSLILFELNASTYNLLSTVKSPTLHCLKIDLFCNAQEAWDCLMELLKYHHSKLIELGFNHLPTHLCRVAESSDVSFCFEVLETLDVGRFQQVGCRRCSRWFINNDYQSLVSLQSTGEIRAELGKKAPKL